MSDEIGAVVEAAVDLVGRSKTCVLTTIDSEGFPSARAMFAPRERLGMNRLIFSTNATSRHVTHLLENPRACLYFYDPVLFQGLLLKGEMEVTRSQEIRDRVWQDGDEFYYPLGPADPELTILVFTAMQGRWYQNLESADFAL